LLQSLVVVAASEGPNELCTCADGSVWANCGTHATQTVHLPLLEELEAEAAMRMTDAMKPHTHSFRFGGIDPERIDESGGVVPESGEMVSLLGDSFLEDHVDGSVVAQHQGERHI